MSHYFIVVINGLKRRWYLLVLIVIALIFIMLFNYKDERSQVDEIVFNKTSVIQNMVKKNNFKDAIKYSRNLVKIYPKHYMPHGLLGIVLLAYGGKISGLQKSHVIEEGLKELKLAVELSKQAKIYVKNQNLNLQLGYAQALEENNHLEKALTYFKKYFDGNKEKVIADPELRYFVVSYAKVLGKMGRNVEAIQKYQESFIANGRDPLLVQSYIKMLSDYDGLEGALDIANDYDKYGGFNVLIVYAKCQALYDHKVFKKAKSCLESLTKTITENKKNIDYYEKYYKDSMSMLKSIVDISKTN